MLSPRQSFEDNIRPADLLRKVVRLTSRLKELKQQAHPQGKA
jgi:hypothetical protein